METIKLAEKKMMLFQKIMSIENEKALSALNTLIDKILSDIENNEEIAIEDLSFAEWNCLFIDNKNLNEYLPEYEMTLGE